MSTSPKKKMTLDSKGKPKIEITNQAAIDAGLDGSESVSLFEDDEGERLYTDTFQVEGQPVRVRELSSAAINRYRADERQVTELAQCATRIGADFDALCDQARALLEKEPENRARLAKIDEQIASAQSEENPLSGAERFALYSTALVRAYLCRILVAGISGWGFKRADGTPVPYSPAAVEKLSFKIQKDLGQRLIHYSVFGEDLADFLPAS